jgi:hypothetical protein
MRPSVRSRNRSTLRRFGSSTPNACAIRHAKRHSRKAGAVSGAARSRRRRLRRCPVYTKDYDAAGACGMGCRRRNTNVRWKDRGATYDAFKVRLTERLRAKFAAHMPEAAM